MEQFDPFANHEHLLTSPGGDLSLGNCSSISIAVEEEPTDLSENVSSVFETNDFLVNYRNVEEVLFLDSVETREKVSVWQID